jgi:hypothetical protein
MGAEQSQTAEVEYEEKIFTKLGCIAQNKAILPSNAAVLMYQLKNLKPNEVDLTRADQTTRDEFARMRYNENSGIWFYDGDYNYTSEFLDHVAKMVDETGCNKWVTFYGFVLNDYDVERTKHYCYDNFANTKQSVYNIPLQSDAEGWRIIYEKILELPSIKTYRPPEGYRVQRRQQNDVNANILRRMFSDHNDNQYYQEDEDDDQVPELVEF